MTAHFVVVATVLSLGCSVFAVRTVPTSLGRTSAITGLPFGQPARYSVVQIDGVGIVLQTEYWDFDCTAKKRSWRAYSRVCVLVTICCSWWGLYEQLHRISFGLCSNPPRAEKLRKCVYAIISMFSFLIIAGFLFLFLFFVFISKSIFRRRFILILCLMLMNG